MTIKQGQTGKWRDHTIVVYYNTQNRRRLKLWRDRTGREVEWEREARRQKREEEEEEEEKGGKEAGRGGREGRIKQEMAGILSSFAAAFADSDYDGTGVEALLEQISEGISIDERRRY